jgi:CopG family nickel-responsive transcriptional regulator
LTGKLNAVLLVAHDQKAEDAVTGIKHKFEDITNTHIHSHLRENKCLEVFILKGDAERIKKLARMFQTDRKIEYTKLIIA